MMGQVYRRASGGRVDRSKPVSFLFNNKPIQAHAGDTVASALLANGIKLVGRSFKYHRPRGILSHGSDEPNALLEVDRGPGRIDPNNRATAIEVTEGLVTRSQNHWPSLDHDFGAVSNLLSPLFASGFYYKTFMWPRSFWNRVYEPSIRAAAGLGVAPVSPDPDRYAHRHAHCDVLVIGAGPAGLAAALAASENGTRVILADEQAELGGCLLHESEAGIDGLSADGWREKTIGELSRRDNVTILPRTTAFGYYNHNHIGMVERVSDHLAHVGSGIPRERLWQVRAKEVVLATGAHERPLVFADNDRPGVMLAESIRVFANRYAVVPGCRLVFVTNGASAYRAATDVRAGGSDVTIVDLRPDAVCGVEAAAARGQGIEVLTEHTVLGCQGRKAVSGVVVAPVRAIGQSRLLPCDCVGVSGGWTPAVHLHSQSRGKLVFRTEIDAFVPGVSVQAERSAGGANGTYDLAGCIAEGRDAGIAAAGRKQPRSISSPAAPTQSISMDVLPSGRKGTPAMAFVDFQNDVTAKDIRLAVREGFESIEHIKRYTTTGMATDQGKSSNMTALSIAAATLSRPIAAVGTTTFRPPYTPVSFGALVGPARAELFQPIRTTPLYDWSEEQGAAFENVGLWRRAWFFPRAGEAMQEAVARECRAVRTAVGIFDASTLGKIEVVGPDAAEFMDRLYINGWSKLEPGRCRYGVMLKEDGYIFDDGVVARLAADRFHVTTTTGGAPRVLAHMEDYLQTEWPDLRVYLTSITEQWAVIAVQGPKAREVIAPFVSDIDLSPAAFPHMSVRQGRICGIPTRLFRVSFTGELGYEINVPSDYAAAVWKSLYQAGEPHGIAPYGTETMHVLRAERGFIIVGQETDGTVTPDDVGLARMIAQAKPDFVGKRSLARPDLVRADRKQLVGLLTDAPRVVLEEGAQVVADPHAPVPIKSLGHVTSSYWSEACGHSIALALVANGRALKGRNLFITTPTGFTRTRVTDPVFFDGEGARVNG
jgi:sarcosine oxidase subunit alpha